MIALMKVDLRAEDMYWLGDTADEQAHDPCAHGTVTLAIGETLFAGPPEADGLNVTGAGLFLLRTFSYSHTPPGWLVTEGADSNQLLPCCANPLPASTNDEFAVYVDGSPYGVNVEIVRDDGTVVVRRGEDSARVSAEDWRTAVLGFCEAVEAFYEASPPRLPLDDDEDEWWESFWQEWRGRKRIALVGR
jgi:hypothetical protein